jgi:hypothetical protein
VRFNSDNGGLEFYDGTTWNPVSPIAPKTGFKNLSIVNAASAQSVTVAFDEAFVSTAAGKAQRISTSSYTATISANFAGGGNLDTGAVASNTLYYIHLAYNASAATSNILFSVNASVPTFPAGYAASARLGATFTATTGTNLRKISQLGRNAQYIVSASVTTVLPQMIAGSSGSPTTPTWTAVGVAGFIPTTASQIRVMLFGESGQTVNAAAAPNNSYGATSSTTNPPPLNQNGLGGSAGGGGSSTGDFVLESTNVYYASSGAASFLACLGWTDNL